MSRILSSKEQKHRNIRNKNTNKSGKYKKFLIWSYSIIIIIMVVKICISLFDKNSNTSYYGVDNFETIDQSWVDKDGKPFNFKNIEKYIETSDGYVSTYYNIPNEVSETQTIAFLSKNVYCTVLIDGEIVYKTDTTHGAFYNRSPGIQWNLFQYKSSDAGKVVELRIEPVYKSGHAYVNSVYKGDRAAIVLHIVRTKIVDIYVCIILLFLGVFYFSVSAILNYKNEYKNYSIINLANAAIFCAIWGLCETNILQFFIGNNRMIHMVSNMSLLLLGMPLLLYLDWSNNIFRSKKNRILGILLVFYMMITMILHAFKVIDYQQSISWSAAVALSLFLMMIGCIIRSWKEYKITSDKKREDIIYYYLQQLGEIVLCTSILIDFHRYIVFDVEDHAFYMRIGMLIFILCLGAANIINFFSLIRKGEKVEVISKLAYEDGLTEIGNRTAYKERIERLIKQNESYEGNDNRLGIIMFDINNLKQVNDQKGHQIGDDMIKKSAMIINSVFKDIGETYRIGGDEFTTLITSSNGIEKCEKKIEQLLGEIKKINQNSMHYQITIAYGFVICEDRSVESIDRAIHIADCKMYQNKQESKSKMNLS